MNVAVSLVVLATLVVSCTSQSETCIGRCGEYDSTAACQCNGFCLDYDDCCSDYTTVCLSCQDRCDESYEPSQPCQCNSECPIYGNCCDDYDAVCGGGNGTSTTTSASTATDSDVIALTEDIYILDQPLLVGDLISINTSTSNPLFNSVNETAFDGPTISAFLPLRDNYNPYTDVAESVDAEEQSEIDAFLDAVMDTDVMLRTEQFMYEFNMIDKPLRDVIEDIFFTNYVRADGVVGSSGFEHVFMGEIDDGAVGGFHNWVSFYFDELEGDLNYTEYQGELTIGSDLDLLQMGFDWLSYTKEISSMWIGSTPELELALYTVCFYHKPNSLCNVSMNGLPYQIQTVTESYNGGTYVHTAYPVVPLGMA